MAGKCSRAPQSFHPSVPGGQRKTGRVWYHLLLKYEDTDNFVTWVNVLSCTISIRPFVKFLCLYFLIGGIIILKMYFSSSHNILLWLELFANLTSCLLCAFVILRVYYLSWNSLQYLSSFSVIAKSNAVSNILLPEPFQTYVLDFTKDFFSFATRDAVLLEISIVLLHLTLRTIYWPWLFLILGRALHLDYFLVSFSTLVTFAKSHLHYSVDNSERLNSWTQSSKNCIFH